jgi:hypothetical protein
MVSMALQQDIDYVWNVKLAPIEESDKALEKIINSIHTYLSDYTESKLFLVFSKFYFKRCCRSWVRISTHLEKFLIEPKMNYTVLMSVLDNEIQKFPFYSSYYKLLCDLKSLVSKGKTFNIILPK